LGRGSRPSGSRLIATPALSSQTMALTVMSIARSIGCLILLVIVAAVARSINLWSWHASGDIANVAPDSFDQRLNLSPDHRISRFVAVWRDLGSQPTVLGDVSPPNGSDGNPNTLNQWMAAWLITAGESVTGGTAIVRDSDGNLAAIDLLGVLPTTSPQALQALTPQWLATWDTSTHNAQRLGFRQLAIGVWKSDALVYVTGGPDNQPGRAGVDDDLNGIIDDLGELGTTLSDDQIVSPGHPDYQAAADAKVVARVIDRGTVVDVTDSAAIDLTLDTSQSAKTPSHEIWLSFSHAPAAPPRRICLQLK